MGGGVLGLFRLCVLPCAPAVMRQYVYDTGFVAWLIVAWLCVCVFAVGRGASSSGGCVCPGRVGGSVTVQSPAGSGLVQGGGCAPGRVCRSGSPRSCRPSPSPSPSRPGCDPGVVCDLGPGGGGGGRGPWGWRGWRGWWRAQAGDGSLGGHCPGALPLWRRGVLERASVTLCLGRHRTAF
jgi:hypothetical protein